MVTTEVIVVGGIGVLVIGGGVTMLVHWLRKRNQSISELWTSIPEERQQEVLQKMLHQDNQSKKVFDLDDLIKNSDDLEKLLLADDAHRQTYEKILSDKELLKKLHDAPTKEEARQILLDWLWEHQKRKEVRKPAGRVRGKKKDTQEPAEERKKVIASVLEKPAKKAYQELVDAIDENNIDKFIGIINSLPSETFNFLIKEYGIIKIDRPSPKVDAFLSRSKTKQEVFASVKLEVVRSLQNQYDDLHLRLSMLRKKGFDVKQEDLLLGGIPPKIKAFSLTFDKNDLSRVRNALELVDKELNIREKLVPTEQ